MINLEPFPEQDSDQPVSNEQFLARIRGWIAEMAPDEIMWILANGSAEEFAAHFQGKELTLNATPDETWQTFCEELTARLEVLNTIHRQAGMA